MITKDQLREHLIRIIIKGGARGGYEPTADEAAAILDQLASSDDHPVWGAFKQGRDQLHQVIAIYRTR